MELKELTEKVREAIKEAIEECIREGHKAAVGTVNLNDGYIDMMVEKSPNWEAILYHNDDDTRTSPNIEAYVENIIKEYTTEKAWLEIEIEMMEEAAPTPEEEYFMDRKRLQSFNKKLRELKAMYKKCHSNH
jgi:hypothetical protein